MAAMNTTERQKKTRMLERSHSRVPPEIEIALLQRGGICAYVHGGSHSKGATTMQRVQFFQEHTALDYIYQEISKEVEERRRIGTNWVLLGSVALSDSSLCEAKPIHTSIHSPTQPPSLIPRLSPQTEGEERAW